MITIDHLSVRYEATTVLHDLSLTLDEHQVHGLVGLNGSGKTTLLDTLYGFIKPYRGKILFQGKPLVRSAIAYQESMTYFYPNITGQEYLQLFQSPTPFSAQDWQQLLQLPLDALIETYSMGMQKKLSLLSVIRLDRPIMILDEPFNGLDLEAVQVLKTIIAKLRQREKTVLLTSHILETLTDTCDCIHYLRQGRVQQSFAPNEFGELEREIAQAVREKTEDAIDRLL